jgi:biotin transport system substrate-specific component
MRLKPIVFSLVFTGLIVAGAQVEVPFGPVPFILSDFFVLLAGLMLGGLWAGVSVGLYLLLGAMGLPVYAGGEGGVEHLIGPTGGYLFGFWLGSMLTGIIAHRGACKLWKDAVGTLSGQACFFLLGVTWLTFATEMPLAEAISKGFLTFLVPIGLKFAGAVLAAQLLRRIPFLDLTA